MKIFDCFMYYDEDLILDLRLNLLDSYVDEFVIVESSYTHSGEPRKLLFDINNYSKFRNKIKYIILKDLPSDLFIINETDSEHKKNSKYILNAVKRENLQRNTITKGLEHAAAEDLIIISDVDEIPNLEDNNIRDIKSKVYPLWRIDIMFSNKKYQNIKIINKGGWHFSNIKTPANIEKKMKTYLHHREYELNPVGIEKISEIIKQKKPIYNLKTDMRSNKFDLSEKLMVSNISELPYYIQKNIDKYKDWLN